jgi:hypothetical protein
MQAFVKLFVILRVTSMQNPDHKLVAAYIVKLLKLCSATRDAHRKLKAICLRHATKLKFKSLKQLGT